MASSNRFVVLFLVTLLVFSVTMETAEAWWNPFKSGSRPVSAVQGQNQQCTNPKDCPGDLIKS